MSDEDALLAAIIAAPDDDTPRLVYADWLDDHDQPACAEYLRLGVEIEKLSAEKTRNKSNARMDELSGQLDPGWFALVATLGVPFREEHFGYEPGVHPFTERFGSRGSLFTFESQFHSPHLDPGLKDDIQLLHGRELGECAYGASDFPIYPFLVELPTACDTPTGANVIEALKIRSFRSEHIRTLDATTIPYPGYHAGTDNDEIHTESRQTFIFPGRRNTPDASEVHDLLKGYVNDGRLWYVLLHSWHEPDEYGLNKDGTVVLFAVGRSPHGSRLVGVVTAQVCHNLCD
jgi:uncharacterized protein (TIGR02996 family)